MHKKTKLFSSKVISFFNENYSCFVQGWIENIFSKVPNNGLPLETWGHLNTPFKTDRHHKLYRYNIVCPPNRKYFKLYPVCQCLAVCLYFSLITEPIWFFIDVGKIYVYLGEREIFKLIKVKSGGYVFLKELHHIK